MTRAPHLDPAEIAAADTVADSAVPEAAALEGAEETYVVPASLEQARYWTLAQLDPGSTASNMAISCEIAGALDPLIVEQSIAALTLRHEALRTLFRMVDGQLSQLILTRPLYEFKQLDLEFKQQDLSRPGGKADPHTELAAALDAHSHLAIDLANGPVLRACLIRMTPEHHVLALTMNHIVCDGWSNGLLVRDLLRMYEALRAGAGTIEDVAAGPVSGLPELPFQFADFTVWQQEYLASDRAAKALAFWNSHIPRDLPALDMPADHPRRAGRSFPGTIASALLPSSLNDALAAYCRRSGSTKHIVLLTVFEALCARFSGQQRFLLGSTIANRTQPGMEDVVGRFANPQIIVADVEGDPSFHDLELRVREWETSAYTHQDMPFSRIVEAFQLNQEGAGSQFLEVWFVYQRAFMKPQEVPGLTLTPLRSVSGGVDFDLLVSVVERTEGPRLQIEYNTELFTSERIAGLLASFEQMLAGALAHPEQPISRIELAGMAPSATAVPIALSRVATSVGPTDLMASITAHSTARAHVIAVRAGGRQLTWSELTERSGALAAHLRKEDLTRATTAFVVLTPEIESLIALLALLQLGESGPRITPLPAHTASTDLPHVASDNTVVLAPARLLRELMKSPSRRVAYEGIATLPASGPSEPALGMPRDWGALAVRQMDAEPGPTYVTEYVSFAETLRSIASLAERLQLSAADGLLAIAPSSPADALFDLLLALHTRATLNLVADHSGTKLQELLNDRQASVAIAEPAQWREWIGDGWNGDRRITAVARGRHAAYSSSLPHGDSAGPGLTRSSVAVLSEPSGPLATAPGWGDAFLPLPGVTLSVVDSQRRSVPPGAAGELVRLSDGAPQPSGYLAQAGASGLRVNGTTASILHLHGHRVRLSDLEDALLRVPGVLDAAALAGTREDGTTKLSAWVAGRDGLNVDALRQQLASTLPEHLVPSGLAVVSAIPFRLDGSVDATALRSAAAPNHSAAPSPSTAEEAVLGTDDVSRELADIWKETLNLPGVDPQVSFFAAGGNSLLLVRLFARINKAFGTRLPITTIFDADTIGKLSARLRQQGEIRAMVPVQIHGHRPPVFMIHSYLLYQGLSQALGSTQPFYGLRELEADSDLGVDERVANYVREIRAVQPHGPYSVMGWCAAGPLAVEVARQLVDAGESIASVILFDSWLPGYLNSVEGVKANGSLAPKLNGIRAKLRRHDEKMRTLSTGQRVRYLRGAFSRYLLTHRNRFFIRHWSTINALANRFHLPLPQFMYNTTLNTFAALNAYRARPVPIRLTLIRAHDTRDIPGASAACGWEQVAMHGVDVLWAPGDHETMFLGEKLEATTELIRRCLQHAELNGMPQATASPTSSRADGRLLHAGNL